MHFGETLSLVMTEKGMKAKELSDRCGVTAPYISQLVNGKLKDPTFTKAVAIINGLDMTVSEFIEIQDASDRKSAAERMSHIMSGRNE